MLHPCHVAPSWGHLAYSLPSWACEALGLGFSWDWAPWCWTWDSLRLVPCLAVWSWAGDCLGYSLPGGSWHQTGVSNQIIFNSAFPACNISITEYGMMKHNSHFCFYVAVYPSI